MIQMHINSLSSQEAYWPSGPHDLFLLPELLARFSNNTLLRDDNGVTVRYADIAELARSKAFKTARRRLVICGVNNDVYGLQGYLALLAVTCLVFSSQFHLETLAPVVDSDFHCDTNSSGVLYSRLEWGRTVL